MSSLGDMLSVRLDADQQGIFLDTYRSTNGDPDALWSSLADRGFDERTIGALQTDAVLGELTRQNAPVVGRLAERTGLGDAAELADHGFYRAAAWRDVVGDDVPEGLTVEQYTSGLAAQVATRFPARVTADLVRSDAVAVAPEAKDEVAAFFAQRGADASIGVAPVRTWEGFADLSATAREGALKVERLFQISPSNDAMVALSSVGIDSALQVMRYSPTGFVAAFGDKFPSTMEARLTYAKAQQVHTTALTIATQYLAYRGAPNVYSITGRLTRQAPAPDPEIVASATLEDLFGSMDYCSCDHCRSVLSPAAYLVELLEFVDVGDEPHTLDNPLDVLLARRPDLQHLGLSCENTNTALPYVDLVLEILEHWVVNGTLVGYEGHDTRPDAATADLLADPEFVVDAAYDTTKAAVYPSPLPFDAPLVHLRTLFEVWDTSLPAALDVLGTPADARREWLGPQRRGAVAAHRRRVPCAAGAVRRAGRDDARRAQRDRRATRRRSAGAPTSPTSSSRTCCGRRSSTRGRCSCRCSRRCRCRSARSSSGSTARSPTASSPTCCRTTSTRRRTAATCSRGSTRTATSSWARSRSPT